MTIILLTFLLITATSMALAIHEHLLRCEVEKCIRCPWFADKRWLRASGGRQT